MGTIHWAPAMVPVRFEGNEVVDCPYAIGDSSWKITCLSVGNPHCVIFADTIDQIDLENEGRQLEHAPIFPDRTNVEFVESWIHVPCGYVSGSVPTERH